MIAVALKDLDWFLRDSMLWLRAAIVVGLLSVCVSTARADHVGCTTLDGLEGLRRLTGPEFSSAVKASHGACRRFPKGTHGTVVAGDSSSIAVRMDDGKVYWLDAGAVRQDLPTKNNPAPSADHYRGAALDALDAAQDAANRGDRAGACAAAIAAHAAIKMNPRDLNPSEDAKLVEEIREICGIEH